MGGVQVGVGGFLGPKWDPGSPTAPHTPFGPGKPPAPTWKPKQGVGGEGACTGHMCTCMGMCAQARGHMHMCVCMQGGGVLARECSHCILGIWTHASACGTGARSLGTWHQKG